MDVKSTWIPTWHWMGHVSWSLGLFLKPPLGGRPNTKLDGTLNAYNPWVILFYHAWGPAWIEIHWNSIWLRTQSHMTSHYTWGSVITLHDFGGVLGRPLDAFFWTLTISWPRLLAHSIPSVSKKNWYYNFCYSNFFASFLVFVLMFLLLLLLLFLFLFICFWDRRPTMPTPSALRTKKTCPQWGEAGPLGCNTLQRNSNNDWPLPRKTHRNPPNQRQPTPPPKKLQWLTTYIAISNSIEMWIVPPIENIPSTPHLVKTLEDGHNIEVVDLDLFDHPFLCRLGKDNESFPNMMLDLRHVPLFMVEHFVIALNPNGPKRNPPPQGGAKIWS